MYCAYLYFATNNFATLPDKIMTDISPFFTGVAELGGGHGPPPQNLSGRARVCFGPPPQNFDHWPSQNGASGGQIASENPEMGKIFKNFCLWRANKRKTDLSDDFRL